MRHHLPLFSKQALRIFAVALLTTALCASCCRLNEPASIRSSAVKLEAMRSHAKMIPFCNRQRFNGPGAFVITRRAYQEASVLSPFMTRPIQQFETMKNTRFHNLPRYSFCNHVHLMSTAFSSELTKQSTPEALSNEEKSIFHELQLLSERIRMLDAIYYGRSDSKDDSSSSLFSGDAEVSDEEYDALARKEAEICTNYPHLLTLLEKETGLGSKATRYGGRVGQLYSENNVRDEDDVLSKKKSKPKKSRSVVKKRMKRHHLPNAPMQSLDNAMDEAEAVAWLNRVRKLLLAAKTDDATDHLEFQSTILAEPKIDGLSLSLRYELQSSDDMNNQYVYKFVWAATRGDGSQGEDVSEAVQAAWMKNSTGNYSVPNTFTINIDPKYVAGSVPSAIEVRGEVVLPQESFKQFSSNISESSNVTSFSNARNAASGILLRSKEPTSDEELERTRWLQSRLRFYAYDVAVSGDSPGGVWLDQVVGSNMDDMRSALNRFGFEVPNPVISDAVSVSSARELDLSHIPNLLEYHHKLLTSRGEIVAKSSSAKANTKSQKSDQQQDKPPYQIDGVVYKLSDFHDRQICGSSTRTPRWAIAHKFPPMSAVTRLLDIDIQVGRTGALTPVAILEAVDLGGVLVSRASLHNFHFAKKVLLPSTDASNNDVGTSPSVKSGISVLVSRAGDVIPQVMKRIFDDAAEDEIDALKNGHELRIISLEPPTQCPACGSPTTFEFMSSSSQHKNGKKKKKAKQPVQYDTNTTSNNDDKLDTAPLDDNGVSAGLASSSIENETGQVLRCSGPQLLCQPRAVNAMAYAYSRPGLDVKGISKAKLQQLIEGDIVRFPADLFLAFGNKTEESASKREDMLQKIADLPGWGNISSENLADSIEAVASKGVPLSRFIYSLGIPFIGTHASNLIAATYKTADSFLHALHKASNYNETENTDEGSHPFVFLAGNEATNKVKGIGPVALSSLLVYSKEKILVDAAKDLAQALTIHDDLAVQINDSTNDNSPFKDMIVVFTGALPMSRSAAQNAVKRLGAKSTPNTISKSTTLVVVGDKGGKKANQAKELGVRVIDADEFMQLINP